MTRREHFILGFFAAVHLESIIFIIVSMLELSPNTPDILILAFGLSLGGFTIGGLIFFLNGFFEDQPPLTPPSSISSPED